MYTKVENCPHLLATYHVIYVPVHVYVLTTDNGHPMVTKAHEPLYHLS